MPRCSAQLIWRIVHISSASQASSLVDRARALELADAGLHALELTSSMSWSPGSTGRLKRAPSMPAK